MPLSFPSSPLRRMSISIDLHPSSNVLHMYGEPDVASAYSLSGHVSLSITSPYSFFQRRQPACFLLQSLLLTFEGQCEIASPKIGYSAIRLCSLTRELVSHEPIELTNEGQEDLDEPCRWNITFNIPIPGWLPATRPFGFEEDFGNCYALYATAKVTTLGDSNSNLSFSVFCSPFCSRTKTLHAVKDITIERFIRPPAMDNSLPSFPSSTFVVNSPVFTPKTSLDAPRIPSEILSGIQIQALVPGHISVNDRYIPLTLRIRAKDLSDSDCKKLRVVSFQADVLQTESARYRPSVEYQFKYPLPTRSDQPPFLPLRRPHPISLIYDLGLNSYPPTSDCGSSCPYSLLPQNESGHYALSGDNYVFADDHSTSGTTWYTMEAKIPIVHIGRQKCDTSDWPESIQLQPTASSPLFSTRHEVLVGLSCSYDVSPGKQATDIIQFSVPISFVHLAPILSPTNGPSSMNVVLTLPMNARCRSQPASYPQPLPAYSQLFDSNGERKVDYSIPLPLYTPNPFPPSINSDNAAGQAKEQ